MPLFLKYPAGKCGITCFSWNYVGTQVVESCLWQLRWLLRDCLWPMCVNIKSSLLVGVADCSGAMKAIYDFGRRIQNSVTRSSSSSIFGSVILENNFEKVSLVTFLKMCLSPTHIIFFLSWIPVEHGEKKNCLGSKGFKGAPKSWHFKSCNFNEWHETEGRNHAKTR